MFFDRPSRFDFGAWAHVGSPELDSSPYKWDHDSLFPYFKKAVTFTPTILHQSGIGPASVLRKYGIPVALDLPGVGANLQHHSGASVAWNYTKPGKFYPMPADMLNTTFAAQAAADFDKLPAQGPYTLSMSNSAIFVPLPNITINYPDIITKIRAMAENNSFASYLPRDYASDTTSSLYSGYNLNCSLSPTSSRIRRP